MFYLTTHCVCVCLSVGLPVCIYPDLIKMNWFGMLLLEVLLEINT